MAPPTTHWFHSAGNMLDTTFVMVVGWDGSEWDCSCHVMDPIWHIANEDAKAKSETPAAAFASEPEHCCTRPPRLCRRGTGSTDFKTGGMLSNNFVVMCAGTAACGPALAASETSSGTWPKSNDR